MCQGNCDCGDNCTCKKKRKNPFPLPKKNDIHCTCDPEKDMTEEPNSSCPVHKEKKSE
ncbi:MAG TPA: hypothetical protein P5230_00075 [Candidatus Magasanikbacteria bacterium]|nr:hypothetical protein [Candidatus Magasanikbacteria bacterium]